MNKKILTIIALLTFEQNDIIKVRTCGSFHRSCISRPPPRRRPAGFWRTTPPFPTPPRPAALLCELPFSQRRTSGNWQFPPAPPCGA